MKIYSCLCVGFIAGALAGCTRVQEYKCSAEQIYSANAQFEWCRRGVTSAVESKSTHECWAEATRAHCDLVREFTRTGREVTE